MAFRFFSFRLRGAGTIAFLLYKYGKGLPDYGQLANYKPPVVTESIAVMADY